MKLTRDKVAIINYTLKDKEGKIIDKSNDGTFTYLQGRRNVIAGMEKALADQEAGFKISVVIEPVDAYGERDLEKVQRVPLSMFPDEVELQPGMQFESQSTEGAPVIVTVTEIEAGEAIVDENHPMAGVQLHFDLELVDVRDATEQELEHGHVHGPDGHDH